jgi:hypothetical protein
MAGFFTSSESIQGLVDKNILKALTVLAGDSSSKATETAACLLAGLFGDDGTFPQLLIKKNAARDAVEQKFISKFHKNLQLLIKKSWVEKYDEALKEQVLCRLENFCAKIAQADYVGAYKEFREVLADTVYLMFGAQSKKDEFAEYAMRIDPEFGIFWLYVKALAANTVNDNEKCRILLLLGSVFLANY